MTLKEIKDYIVARIYNNNTQKITGEVLQDTLSTMADSMNAPSGDPMHYAYEAAGAVWNDATSAWMLNEESVTTEDIRAIYAERYISRGANMWMAYYRGSINTTNISNCIWNHSASIADAFLGCSNIITASLGSKGTTAVANNITNAFRNCSKLRKVINTINMQYCTTTTDAFLNCSKLEAVTLKNTKASISFAQSPNLSKESILYMIRNSAATSSITITLHPTAYAMAIADADIKSALASKTYVKLASA